MDKRTLRSKKDKPRNAKQYDRQNQGIFGKVYSTVRGIIKPVCWLNTVTNYFSGSSVEEQSGRSPDIEEETVREDNDVVSQSISHGNKRLRLRFEDNIPSIQSSGTQTWPDQPSQNLYDVSHVQSSTAQRSLLENKESIAVLNGDDHSENSEGSASTSGCSSLVSSHKDSNRIVESPFHSLRSELKNCRKRKEPSSSKSGLDDLNSSRTLWSSSFSQSSKFQRRLPTISHTNQPSFNLSTFVSPSKLNESVEKKISSPFYDGRTTFGGASASRRMPPSVAPYQVDKTLRNQIRVREQNSEDNLEGMSSAAKRILLTLEKMSTPVADAKKIPNTKTSPVDLSVYLTPPKSRRNSQFTPSVSSKGPPITNVNTIAKLATLKNYGVNRLRNAIPSSPAASIGQESFTFDILQTNTSESVIQKSGGGKMKNKLNQHHFSKNVNEENEVLDAPILPNIPLPITKLPTINFGAKTEKPSDSHLSSKDFKFSSPIEHDLSISKAVPASSFALPSSFDTKTEKNSDLQPKSFIFSSPIEHELPNNTLPKDNPSLPVTSTTMSVFSSCSTWECSTCWIQNPIGRISCVSCETPRVPKESHSTLKFKSTAEETQSSPAVCTSHAVSTSNLGFSSTSSTAFTFGTQSKTTTPKPFSFGSSGSNASTWECTSCWVRNAENESKCVACETVRAKKDSSNVKAVDTNSFVPSVTTTSATWECSSCWIKNPVKESKCLACEAPHSAHETNQGSSSAVSISANMWECKSCWVQNPLTELKCMACETARSSKDSSEMKSTANVFSTWECTSCWVRNPMKEKKCIACETLHPNADKTSGSKDINGFKFSSPIQNSPITFKFGNYICTAPSTATTSTFKFGITASESQTATSASSFKFGTPSSTSGSSFFSSPVSTAVSKTSDASSLMQSSNATALKILSVPFGSSENKQAEQNSDNLTNEISYTNNKFNSMSKVPSLAPVPSKINSEINNPLQFNSSVGKNTVNEAFMSKTSETLGQSTVNAEISNPSLADKGCENKISNSVITNTCSETLVSKEKEVVTPSVTACFGFTTQPLLDSNKSDGFSFGAPKEKSSSHSLPSPFNLFPTPSNKVKCTTDDKLVQHNTKDPNANTENKLPSVFQLANPTQAVSSVFTMVSSAPVFKFGDNTDPSKGDLSTTSVALTTGTTTSFCFTSNSSNFGSITDSKTSNASECLPPPAVKTEDAKISTTFSSVPTTSSFVFGSTAITSAPSAFTFFPSSSATSTPASSVFTFGASSNTVQASKSGGFTFKGCEKAQTATSTPSATSQSTTSGLNIATSVPVPAGGFVFGAPKTEAQNTAAAPFAFGSGTASSSSSNTSAFSAFQPSQPANPAFQFGNQPAGSTASTLGASNNFAFPKTEASNQVPSSVSQNPASAFGSSTNFVFGTKSETPNQIPSTVSQAPGLAFGSSTSSFSFNSKTENTSTVSQNPNPTFGSSTMPSVFGNTVVPSFGGTDKPVSGGFNFGGVSTSGVFQFGASNNTERKRTATASGFSFGTPPASETNNSFTAGFNINTPPSFNFGATSTPSGPVPFQFAASSAPKSAAPQNAPRKYRKALRRVRKE